MKLEDLERVGESGARTISSWTTIRTSREPTSLVQG